MMIKPLLIIALTLVSLASNAQTKIIAHRGYSSIAPENTLIAFRKAIEIGADYIELDVHKTRDGKIVVIHDASIDRTSTTGKKGIVNAMTLEELNAIYVGHPKKYGTTYQDQKIPTLKEVLELAKGKIKVCVEIKVHDIEAEVLDIIADLEMEDEIVIFSFYYSVLTLIRELNNTIPILYLKSEISSETITLAKGINAMAIGVGSRTRITKKLLKKAHDNDLELWQWTINEDEKIQRLIDLNIDGIITNYPNIAVEKMTSKVPN